MVSREVLEHATGRWGALALAALVDGPLRFAEVRGRSPGSRAGCSGRPSTPGGPRPGDAYPARPDGRPARRLRTHRPRATHRRASAT
ncbi:hypothetical protein ACRAWF_36595 [Streptomyces sp. L7]